MLYLIENTVRKKNSKVQMGEQKCYKSVTTIYKFTMILCVHPLYSIRYFWPEKKY